MEREIILEFYSNLKREECIQKFIKSHEDSIKNIVVVGDNYIIYDVVEYRSKENELEENLFLIFFPNIPIFEKHFDISFFRDTKKKSCFKEVYISTMLDYYCIMILGKKEKENGDINDCMNEMFYFFCLVKNKYNNGVLKKNKHPLLLLENYILKSIF